MMTLHGAGLGYKRALAEHFLALDSQSPIQFIEIAPENWIRMGGKARKLFDAVAERFPIACHGLSLSLGGQDPLQENFLREIKTFLRQYNIPFFSEHLSYCSDHGHLYDLLPLPFTEDSIHHTAQRIKRVQEILEMRIAIENTSYYLHSPLAEMTEVAFLNAVAQEADCNIHLDVNNIYVNAINHHLVSPEEYLQEVDKSRISYIHIAGHDQEAEHLLIDTHGQAVCDDVWAILDNTYAQLDYTPPCLLERDSNFPSFAELEQEVTRISTIQKKHEKKHYAA